MPKWILTGPEDHEMWAAEIPALLLASLWEEAPEPLTPPSMEQAMDAIAFLREHPDLALMLVTSLWASRFSHLLTPRAR